MSEKKYLPDSVLSYGELINVFDEFRVDSEKTRFYVGQRYEDPKAFVIYRDDDGEFEVYKMKADGSKAVRYRGYNETKAVDEFYQKFLSEVAKRPQFARKLLRRQNGPINRSVSTGSGQDLSIIVPFITIFVSFGLAAFRFLSFWVLPIVGLLSGLLIFLYASSNGNILLKKIIIIAIMVVLFSGFGYSVYSRLSHRRDGYYVTDDGAYYRQGRDYYYYDNGYWSYYGDYHLFDSYYNDYDYYDSYYVNDYYDDFYYSDYYDDYYDDYDYSDDDSGWDDDDSWDSWDSDFDTDWDSDW